MKIIIRSTAAQQLELEDKGFNKEVTVQWVNSNEKYFFDIAADAYFDLAFDDTNPAANELVDDKLVFVNGVNCICKEISKPNYIRLNAWNGFLNRKIIEVCCSSTQWKNKAENVLKNLGWNYAWVADDYGFIAARIIVMIINEAYYALEEKVSTKAQIDIAMKLGTNYPYGPFEWSEKIGLKNILSLLRKMNLNEQRYTISASLVHECQQI